MDRTLADTGLLMLMVIAAYAVMLMLTGLQNVNMVVAIQLSDGTNLIHTLLMSTLGPMVEHFVCHVV